MRKVKWGVLGTADIAKGCTIPGMQMADNCELYAIAGRSAQKAEQFKTEFGFEKAYDSYEALLADSEVEAVYIPLPNHLHYEWVMKAIEAGKNILCEKPMTPTAKMAEELFAAAEAKGVILMEAFAYLHSPYVQSLKDVIDSGIIGDIQYIETEFLTQGYDMSNIRVHKEMYGGATYDLGCYCTSLILTLLDKEPVKVQSLAEFTKEGVDFFETTFMRFDDTLTASFNCGMNLGVNTNDRMDHLYVNGTKGNIKSYVGYNIPGDLTYTVTTYEDGKEIVKKVNAPQNYSLEVAQLGRCITDGEKPHVSKEFTIKNLALIDTILKNINY